MNVTLIGGSGAPNYGDELIALAWLEFLRDVAGPRLESLQVTMDNNSAKRSAEQFQERFGGVQFQAVIKPHRMPDKDAPLLAHLQYGLSFYDGGHWRHHQPLASALEALQDSDLVHLYGGGYINTRFSPHNAMLLGLMAATQRQFGVRLAGTGLGLTPLDFEAGADTRLLAQTLDAFDVFEVRDRHSAQRLRELGVGDRTLVLGLDDAYLRPLRVQPGPPARRLHLSAYRAGNIFEQPAVRAWLTREAPGFDEVCYWLCCPYLERDIVADLQTLWPALRVVGVQELLFEGVPVQRGDHMLTMRYHPHLMAARAGVGGQYVAQNLYYRHKHESVVIAGSRLTALDVQGEPLPPGARNLPSQVDDERWQARKLAVARRVYRLAP
ncbi:MAG: polysaccharide pyruvyl transferase family protein [Proteobacteria bacterium]|nr:polysaccharide pyruvyl transferase family protein [Pseudomonadota bacterium]